jgi:hypothetical protein
MILVPKKTMSRLIWVTVLVIVLAAAGVGLFSQGRNGREIPMPSAVAFRILLGVGDREPTQWDGSVSAAPGAVSSIQGWRFRGEDSTDSVSTWKAWSGASLILIGRQNAGQAPPMLENGVVVAVTNDSATLNVKTKQGDFSFAAADVPFGATKKFLNGRVVVDRVPNTVRLTDSLEDEDFPAVWMSYVKFVRGDRNQHRWNQMGDDAPKSFDFVARPVGGDQVFLMRFDKAKRTWGAPIAVNGTHTDVMRTAVAVDAQKRVWVFWSENRKSNFDIYARSYARGKWSKEIRLTTDSGTDVNPVAVADSGGRVWVAWQGFRNGNLEVLAAAQQGDRFTAESTVSFSQQSDWDPSIAAAPNGEVSIAWDTYDKGDYDVYFRRLRMDGGIRMDAPVPVAASTNFEARSSIAYDKQSRLWVAYEVSEEKWGKDTGPYARKGAGIAIYRNHNVKVKVFQGPNVFEPATGSLNRMLPVVANPMGRQKKQAADEHDPTGSSSLRMSLNNFPRLVTDPNGAVYLAFRTRSAPGRSPAGSVWVQQVSYFDGSQWVGPIAVPNGDQWSDNRPALLSTVPGTLMMIVTSDHRQAETLRDRRPGKRNDNSIPDSVNNDLYAAEMQVNAGAQAQLTAVAAETVSAPDADARPESDQIAMLHSQRAQVGGDQLQVMRGEFHRHTELSNDGNGDGPVIDAYRYMIDAAGMDWGAGFDHDNGTGEYPWWIQQKLTDAYKLGDRYVSMFGYERSVSYPEGHRNTVFAQRGIRPLPRLKKTNAQDPGHAPDTQMLYEYLRKYDGIVASHTSGTDMGTDWRDNDPIVEPVVEIYQGCRQNYEMPGAPRTNTAEYSIGGWRPLGFISLALKKGYRLGFQASSDHTSTHISYCNLWVRERTRAGVMEAFHKRRVYGATDNILAEVRCGAHFMGEEFTVSEAPSISVKLTGTAEFSKVNIIRDGEYVYSIEPHQRNVEFAWKDAAAVRGKTSYYYVRGEQANGELVWASPMWITYQ